MDKIVQNINIEIIRSGLKKKYIAEKMGMNSQQFSNLIHGRRGLKAYELANLARILDCGIDCFFKGIVE